MSSNLAYANPLSRPEHEAPLSPRHIEVVPSRAQRKARPRLAYAVVAIATLFVIFAAQLLLSIVVSQGAYQIEGLQDKKKELLRTEEALHENLDLLGSTQHLAANAAQLGMVPSSNPLFLNIATGAIAGAPGAIDRVGCGGSCNLVANSLLTGMPLTSAAPPTGTVSTAATTAAAAATAPTPAATTPVQQAPVAADEIPAPVTH